MTSCLPYSPESFPSEASDPSPLVVELNELRQRMVRDLEHFLSAELSSPRLTSGLSILRWSRGQSSQTENPVRPAGA